jgi:ankyrin repeat protein
MRAGTTGLAVALLTAALPSACSSKFSADSVFPVGPARSVAHLAETNSLPESLPANLRQGLNIVGRYDLTPLLWSVKNDKVTPGTVAILVRNGADPFYYSKTQLTSPLGHALSYGPIDEFTAIVSNVKAIDEPQSGYPHQPTLLFSAVANRDLAKVQAVVKSGAKLDGRNDLGETPLLYAGTGQLDIMLYLIRVGSNVSVRDSHGHDVCDNVNWLHPDTPDRQRELNAVLSELRTKGVICKRQSH